MFKKKKIQKSIISIFSLTFLSGLISGTSAILLVSISYLKGIELAGIFTWILTISSPISIFLNGQARYLLLKEGDLYRVGLFYQLRLFSNLLFVVLSLLIIYFSNLAPISTCLIWLLIKFLDGIEDLNIGKEILRKRIQLHSNFQIFAYLISLICGLFVLFFFSLNWCLLTVLIIRFLPTIYNMPYMAILFNNTNFKEVLILAKENSKLGFATGINSFSLSSVRSVVGYFGGNSFLGYFGILSQCVMVLDLVVMSSNNLFINRLKNIKIDQLKFFRFSLLMLSFIVILFILYYIFYGKESFSFYYMFLVLFCYVAISRSASININTILIVYGKNSYSLYLSSIGFVVSLIVVLFGVLFNSNVVLLIFGIFALGISPCLKFILSIKKLTTVLNEK